MGYTSNSSIASLPSITSNSIIARRAYSPSSIVVFSVLLTELVFHLVLPYSINLEKTSKPVAGHVAFGT